MGFLETLKEEIRKLEKDADLKEGETVCLHYWTCCTFSSFIKCYEQAVRNGTRVVELKENQHKQGQFLAQASVMVLKYKVWIGITKQM